jgi:hypothetical protein
MRQYIIDFKKAYDSVRREELYNIFTESGVPMKLFRLIKCVEMKPVVKSVQINICLIQFLFRIV